jgi:hypothetical protein
MLPALARFTRRLTVPTVLVFFAFSAVADAQDVGRVNGQVLEPSGGVLPGVIVDLVAGGTNMTAVTDSNGAYAFENVPVGVVELTYRLLNFTAVRRSATVIRDTPTTVDVNLILSLNADVIVTAPLTFRSIEDVDRPQEDLVGIAASASQGAITGHQLDVRPVMRVGEVLETVPGLIVSQHSGEGKANQYYLRGFNLDHGTDFATTVVGVPVNTPTGAHAHGYSDFSFVIPELVSGVQFKKGPYFADEGDFSAAGAANVNYLNRLDRPFVRVSLGGDGWSRALAAASPHLAGGTMLAALELNHNDGPWVRGDAYRKVNSVLRYSRGDNQNGLALTGMGYWADWQSTDQVPQRALASNAIPRFGLIDASDGGRTTRQSVTADIQRSTRGASLRATGFVLHDTVNLFSNFTYFLDDPVRGDQFEQAERRVTAGGRVVYRRLGRIFGRHAESATGVQVRRDWLSPVGLYQTQGRRRLSTTREDRVGQTLAGIYGQTEIEWSREVRTTFGLRTDAYQYSVHSDNPRNTGNGVAGLVSPKFGVVVDPWIGTELYANAGLGFHSNDARGAVTTIDPSTGERVAPVTPLARATGAEVGVRTVRVRGLQSTLSLWYLDLDSELLFVGDAGTTEAARPSRRAGVEWVNYARLTPWLTVDGDLAWSRARFRDADAAGRHIPGALDRVVSAGLTVEPSRLVFGSVRLRHFGPRPLVEDATVRSQATTLWNGEIGYRISRAARVVLEGFNLFDAAVSDIDYFYRSRLPGEPLEGVDDVHTHPALPRTLRLGVHVSF